MPARTRSRSPRSERASSTIPASRRQPPVLPINRAVSYPLLAIPVERPFVDFDSEPRLVYQRCESILRRLRAAWSQFGPHGPVALVTGERDLLNDEIRQAGGQMQC